MLWELLPCLSGCDSESFLKASALRQRTGQSPEHWGNMTCRLRLGQAARADPLLTGWQRWIHCALKLSFENRDAT